MFFAIGARRSLSSKMQRIKSQCLLQFCVKRNVDIGGGKANICNFHNMTWNLFGNHKNRSKIYFKIVNTRNSKANRWHMSDMSFLKFRVVRERSTILWIYGRMNWSKPVVSRSNLFWGMPSWRLNINILLIYGSLVSKCLLKLKKVSLSYSNCCKLEHFKYTIIVFSFTKVIANN